MNCLLDTCAVLWLTDDPDELSEKARGVLDGSDCTIYVSPVSAWELGIKAAKKKLDLPKPVSEWFPEACRRYHLIEIPLTGLLAARSTELPLIHADPFDRLLIATAMEHSLTLVTPDHFIPRYPNLETLW